MISIESDKCINCSICSFVCPHGVIEMRKHGANLVNIDKCVTCGACRLNCPSDAITVVKKTGCVVTIIKEDILKMKATFPKCTEHGKTDDIRSSQDKCCRK